MPKKIEGAKIVSLNSALEIEKTKFDAKLDMSSPEQMQNFLNEEEDALNPWFRRFRMRSKRRKSVRKIDNIVKIIGRKQE